VTPTGPMTTISVIVPALNEERNIAEAVKEVHRAVKGRFSDYEILLFDDGSTDRTGAIMDEIAASDPRVRVTHNPTSRNLGGVYKQGVEMASFDYVVMMPGDNENPSSAMLPAFDAIGRADIVVPYVQREGRPRARRAASRAYVALMNAAFGLHLRYYNGTVIHRTANVRAIRIETDSFAYQAEALVKLLRQGKTFVEVPVELPPSRGGESKAFRPKNVLGVLASVLRLGIAVHVRGARGSCAAS
jgi:glycosyltransferase involved in cell wall biosynthesis